MCTCARPKKNNFKTGRLIVGNFAWSLPSLRSHVSKRPMEGSYVNSENEKLRISNEGRKWRRFSKVLSLALSGYRRASQYQATIASLELSNFCDVAFLVLLRLRFLVSPRIFRCLAHNLEDKGISISIIKAVFSCHSNEQDRMKIDGILYSKAGRHIASSLSFVNFKMYIQYQHHHIRISFVFTCQ